MRALAGTTSFSTYSLVVCAIILCSSVKSSGEKTRPGVVSVIRKLPPLKIVFCVATITQPFHLLATEAQSHRDEEKERWKEGEKKRRSIHTISLPLFPSSVSLCLCG